MKISQIDKIDERDDQSSKWGNKIYICSWIQACIKRQKQRQSVTKTQAYRQTDKVGMNDDDLGYFQPF